MSDWYWIVFDTSEYGKYYGDVHNIIALPPGATYRYDYGVRQITQGALGRVADPKARALFVYTQCQIDYARKDGKSTPTATVPGISYIATRLGRMHNVTQEGERYHFDFTVEEYPAQGTHLVNLMTHLVEREETPLAPNTNGDPAQKYVCVSTNKAALDELSGQDDDAAWAEIVRLLSTPPMQFSQDTFWRLKGPFSRDGNGVVSPKLDKHKTVYQVTMGSNLRFNLVSMLGVGGGQPEIAQVKVKSTNDNVVRVAGTSLLPLRRYTSADIEVRGHSVHLIGQSKENITFDTFPQRADGWPCGPAINLTFRVRRSKGRYALGIFFGLLGLVAYGFGDSKALDCLGLWATGLKVLGTIFLVAPGVLLFGKLSFSGE